MANKKPPRQRLSPTAASFLWLPQAVRDLQPDDAAAAAELAEHLLDLRDRGLGPFYKLLPEEPLTARERKARAARHFRGAAEYVRLTAHGVKSNPELFGDLDTGPDFLIGGQQTADALRDLCCHFRAVLRALDDAYLDVQAHLIDQAQDIHRRVQMEKELAPGDRRVQRRALALAQAANRLAKKKNFKGRPKAGKKRGR